MSYILKTGRYNSNSRSKNCYHSSIVDNVVHLCVNYIKKIEGLQKVDFSSTGKIHRNHRGFTNYID